MKFKHVALEELQPGDQLAMNLSLDTFKQEFTIVTVESVEAYKLDGVQYGVEVKAVSKHGRKLCLPYYISTHVQIVDTAGVC